MYLDCDVTHHEPPVPSLEKMCAIFNNLPLFGKLVLVFLFYCCSIALVFDHKHCS